MQSVQDGLRLKSIPPCRAYHIAGMLKIVLADKNWAWTWRLRGLIWEFICAFREKNNHSKPAPACTTTFPCCCTGGQGGVSWAPSSPWVVETEKKKKVEVHCAKIIEMDRCRTCCNNSPSVGGFSPQPIAPQMLPLLHQSGWPKEFFFLKARRKQR